MKKLLFFFLLLIAGSTMADLSAQIIEVTIGTGTSDTYSAPFDNFYWHSWTETIYPSTDFMAAGGAAGTITSLAWNVSTASSFSIANLKIYLGTTSRASHSSSSDWQAANDLTLVYSHTNTSIGAQTGWETFTLDNPFYYDPSDGNLVVVISKQAASGYSSSLKYYYTSSTNAYMYRNSDSDISYANHPGSNTGNTSSFRANIKITLQTAPITCPRTSFPTVTDIQSSEATLSWTPGGTETSWDLYLTTSASQPDSNTIPTTSSTDTFYTFTGIMDNTFYNAYVRADCGGGDYSDWRGISFRTNCSNEFTIPYLEDFENDGSGIGVYPFCWKLISNASSSNKPYIYTSNYTSGTKSLYVNSTNADYSYMILPEIDPNYTMNQVMAKFDYARLNNNTETKLIVGVMDNDSTISSFVPVDTIMPENCNYWNHKEVYFDNYTGSGRHIAILSDGRHLASNNIFCIDHFEVLPASTCRMPADLHITDVTPNSVTIEWTGTATSWEIAIDTVGYDVDSVSMNYVTATSNPFTLQNLTPDSEFDLYIRGVCGNETTDWSRLLRFKTTCSEFTSLPIIYNFEGDEGGKRPSCMTTMSQSYTNVPMVTSFSNDSTHNKFIYFLTKNNNVQYAVMAPIASTISISDLQMVFRGQTNSIGQQLQIGVMTNPYDPATFELVDIFMPGTTNTWEEHTTFFDHYTGIGQYIAFKYSNSNSSDYRFLVDTVVVDNIATCFVPHNLTISNISAASALVTWDAGLRPLQNNYTLEYSEQGGQWNSITVNDNSYLLTGLTPTTTYNVRVRSNCTQSNSDYCSNRFNTICAAGGENPVGNGTSTTQYFPLYNFYNYALTEQLFTSTELGGAANTIRSISFQCSTATANSRNWSIYLMPTTATSLSGFVNVDSTAMKVFDGVANIHEGWFTIPFDTSFAYNGTSNLILIMHDHTGSYVAGNNYYVHTNPNGSSYYIHQDGSDYNPATASSLNPTSSSYRSNVIFGMDCDNTATCFMPNVVVNNITDITADVTVAANGSETSWTVEYKSSADTGWTSLGTLTANDLPYTLTNLTNNTQYTVRAQANCAASQNSDWNERTFTTECTLLSQLPYTENFDGYTSTGSGTSPDCWHMLTNNTTKYPYISSTSPASGTRCLYFYSYGTLYCASVLPAIDDTQIQINQTMLSLKLKKSYNDNFLKVGIMTDPSDITTFEEVATLSPSTTDIWEQFNVSFGDYTGSGTYVALASYSNLGTTSYMYVDDVVLDEIPNCMIPSYLTTTSVSQNSIGLAWNGNGANTFEVVPVPAGSTLADEIAAGATVMAYEDSILLTGLSHSTQYTLYVRADCSVEYSDWVSIVTNTDQMPAELPYFCDFESDNSGFSFVNGAAVNKWYVGSAVHHGGTRSMYISDNNGISNTYTITQTCNVWAYRDILFPACPNGYIFSFDWLAYGESGYDYMKVFYGDLSEPVNNSQPSGTTELQPNVNSSYPSYFNYISGVQTYTCTIPAMTSDRTMRIYFLWHNDGSVGTQPPASVDNISITPIYCQTPSNLTVNNITAYSADVTWTLPASTSTATLYYKADNDTVWTIESNVTSPFTLSNLNPSSNYTVRVASDCSDGHNSSFITTTFATSCLPLTTLPYEQNFDGVVGTTSTSSNVLPNCWSRLNGGSEYSGLPTVYSSTSYANSGSNSLYFYTYSSSSYADQYAILPELDATIAINTLQLSMSARSYSSSYPFVIQVGVMSNPDSANTFQLVQTLSVTGTSHQHVEAYFNDFTGTGSYIAIKVAKPASNYNYGLIDDIVLEVAPQCSPVTDLTVSNITGASALLSWNNGHFGTPATYMVEYTEAGQNNWTPVGSSVTASPYMLTGLDQTTAYEVRVRTNCSDNSESAWATENFTTNCLVGGDIVFGTGSSTNNYLPFYGTYNYSYSQQIYNASELNVGAGLIRSISFYCSSLPSDNDRTGDIRIWMANMSKSTFTNSTDYISPDSLTEVVVVPGMRPMVLGWNTFTLNQPFMYDGTSNLVVAYYEGFSGWSGMSFWAHSTNDHKSILHYSDTYGNVSYTSPASAAGTSYFQNYRNDILLGIACDSTFTCVAPNMYVTDITSSTATVNWVAGYTESAWEMEYKEDADTVWTPVSVSSSLTETLTSLTQATRYNVRMRSDCGGDYSNWVSTTFTTECDSYQVPFSQNFNNLGSGNSAYPMCWIRDNNYSTSAYPYVSSTEGGSLYFYASPTSYNIAVTPELNASLNTLAVNFKLRSGNVANGLIVGVMDNPDSLDSFVPVDTVFCTTINTLQPMEVYLDTYTGNGRYVAFKTYITSSSSLYMDDLVIDLLPSCKAPTDVTMQNATTTSVDVAWTERGSANSWNIEYGPAGFTPGNGTMVTTTTNPFTIQGLLPSTMYNFYVQANCGGGDVSSWSTVTIGSTQCGAIATLPFTENFDSYGTGETAYPLCWSKINTYSSNRPYVSSTHYAGIGSLYFYAGNSGTYNIAITPEFDATVNMANLEAVFMYRASSSSDKLIVGVITNPQDATTFVPVDTVFPSSTSSSSWIEKTVHFNNYTGNGKYIAFKNEYTTTYGYAYIDNLVIREDSTAVVTCDAPTNVAASNVQQTTATITWTAGGSETSWELQYKTAAASSWSTSSTVTGTPSYNLNGLTPNTQYEVRVRAVCDATTTSDWSALCTFTTQQQDQETCEAPTNVTVSDITSNSAVVTWTQPGNNATSWTVQYKLSAASSWSTVTANTTTHTLTNLDPETNYDVQVIAQCSNNMTSAPSATVTFRTEPDGINGYSLDNSIVVYPNPTNGLVQIQNSELRIQNLEVYDAYGKLLSTIEVNDHTATIDLGGYAKGTYFVRVTTEKGVVTKRVVKN